jgi:hypothetical protein
MIHIAGTRMQAQGTDGLSRGDLTSGVMQGTNLLTFVPLQFTALERSPSLLPWCLSWLPPTFTLVPLSPADWFYKGHGLVGGAPNADGVWIPHNVSSPTTALLWCPAPAVGDVAMQQLSTARLKRPDQLHIFLCPRLMTSIWRKKLYKMADLLFTLPAGARSSWPMNMFEPLVVGILLPFLPAAPWSRRSTKQVLAVESQMRGVWSTSEGDECSILRKLWL